MKFYDPADLEFPMSPIQKCYRQGQRKATQTKITSFITGITSSIINVGIRTYGLEVLSNWRPVWGDGSVADEFVGGQEESVVLYTSWSPRRVGKHEPIGCLIED